MSDLLKAASDALGAPADLISRSAAARATADGTSVDDVLSAWTGGEPLPTPAATTVADSTPQPEEPAEESSSTVITTAEPAPPVVIEAPVAAAMPVPEPEPELDLDPVALRTRLGYAMRVGAWTGAALGVIGFLVASGFWVSSTTALPDGGPAVEVRPILMMIGTALVSVVFGAIVAGVSRAANAWANPAMQLSGSRASTAWLGAVTGLVLGVVGGALLASFGTAIEGSDPATTQLPVLPTLLVMVLGGAILGAATAVIPQLIGVPVAIDETESEEAKSLRGRLGNALRIPLTGLAIFLLLVLPFAFALIETSHLAANGGSIVAIIAAAGILGFASLAGTRPKMRISFGDVLVALAGIGVVLLIVISILGYVGGE